MDYYIVSHDFMHANMVHDPERTLFGQVFRSGPFPDYQSAIIFAAQHDFNHYWLEPVKTGLACSELTARTQ